MELSLGTAIRNRREEFGLTQEELADRVAMLGDEAIRQSDISRIERGQVQMPRLSRLEMIAEALEIPFGELIIEAGWLGPEWRDELDRRTDQDDNVDPGPSPEPGQRPHGPAIRGAYERYAGAQVGSLEHHREFERRRAEFERLVEEFERVREEFERNFNGEPPG